MIQPINIPKPVDYHKPETCSKCGGSMVYKGVGEYKCAGCQSIEYDDYGKVRNYIDQHPGASHSEIEKATGVSDRNLKAMVKDHLIGMGSPFGKVNTCDVCGKAILDGRICPTCKKDQQVLEEIRLKQKASQKKRAYGRVPSDDEAKMHYLHDDEEDGKKSKKGFGGFFHKK